LRFQRCAPVFAETSGDPPDARIQKRPVEVTAGQSRGQSEGHAAQSERRSLSEIRDRIATLKTAIKAVLDADVPDVVLRLANELDAELEAERAELQVRSGAIDLDAERAKRGRS
jgi:hypothetical protein